MCIRDQGYNPVRGAKVIAFARKVLDDAAPLQAGTHKDAAGYKVEGGKRNDNYSLQEASLFLAGRISEHVGSFIQATWSGVDHKTALDQVDVRSIALQAREDFAGERGAVGLVGPADGAWVVDRVMPPRGNPAEEPGAGVDLSRVFEFLQRPEHLHEVPGAVVVTVWLAPPDEKVRACGIHGILERGRGEDCEVLGPPLDERGHAGQSPSPARLRPAPAGSGRLRSTQPG